MKNEDVFASTTLTASVRMLLSFVIDWKSEGYTVFTADVRNKTAFLNSNMRERDVVRQPLPEWSSETLNSSVGTVVWKHKESHCGLRGAPKRLPEHPENILTKEGCVSNQLDPCPWSNAGKQAALAYTVDDLLMVGTRQTVFLGRTLAKSLEEITSM